MSASKPLCRALGLALLLPVSAQADVFINEIHYDTPGTDANESVEVVATGGEDLTLYRIVLYNGSGGAQYDDKPVPAGAQVTCGSTVRVGTINFTALGGQIQNGAPDGLALVGPGNTVVQFLSYEGAFTATNGPAQGMLSVDIGVSEDNIGPLGQSLQLAGNGSSYAQFAWQGEATSTFDACNNGQTFVPAGDNPPAIVSTTPTEGATGVAVTAPIVLNFSEPVAMDVAGVALVCGNPQPLTISGSGASRTLTPDTALPFSASCSLTVLAAAVTDLDGNLDPLAADFVLNFSTGADNPPTLQSSVPANGTPNFPANQNLGVTFSEPVSVGATWFSIVCSTSGTRQVTDTVVSGGPTSWTINPNADFVAGESCTLQLVAAQILDLDGTPDPLSGPAAVSFTAAAVVANPPPQVITTRPLAAAADFPPAAELRVQFSEPVTLTAGAFGLACTASSGIVLSHPSSGSDFYINTGTALIGGDSCSLTVNASAVTDAGGANPTANTTIPFSVKAGTPAIYYASVNGANPGQLRCTLHQAIRGHVTYPYTATGRLDTWDVLELADEDPNNSGNILDAYRNESYPKAGGGNSNYNREHTWPNSLGFPETGLAAYTDTHMLYLTNIGYNSDRGNNRYQNCSGCTERVTVANNGVGGGSGVYPGNSNWFNGSQFEVWNFRKGDMARAVMYMAIRYEGGDSLPNLELTNTPGLITGTPSSAPVAYMGLLDTLITWHQDDPPDALELARNQMVFSFQGNRNPFIDRPEWGTAALFLSANPAVCEPLTQPPLIFANGFEAAPAP